MILSNRINFIGAYTLFMRETRRFMRVYHQTVIAPVVTNLLFFAIFYLAMGKNVDKIGPIKFEHFVASGLVIAGLMQQTFGNSSSSLTQAKMIGPIIDYLMPPLSASEVVCAITGAAIVRGFAATILSLLVFWLLTGLTISHPFVMLLFLVVGSACMGLLGIIAGIWANTFEHVTIIASYIIAPLSFLSGTFYSIHQLPDSLIYLAHYNPFYYLVDGFRYGVTGYYEADWGKGIIVMLIVSGVLWAIAQRLWYKGWKLKN